MTRYLDERGEIITEKQLYLEYLDLSQEEKKKMRKKYGIPLDKKAFVYGGNLGKPQGIDFIIDCSQLRGFSGYTIPIFIRQFHGTICIINDSLLQPYHIFNCFFCPVIS